MSVKLIFKKAERVQKKAKIALIGPSGSGKTMTALRIAAGLKSESGKILVLDTERGSAALYAEHVDFDHADLPNYEYETFLGGLRQAAAAGYEVVIIDSVSHAWQDFLDKHDEATIRSSSNNSFTAWKKITPKYNQLIDAILTAPFHVIVTMRAKQEYVLERDERTGKEKPVRKGLGAVMRPGVEFEFDLVGLVDMEHNLLIDKTRFDFLADKVLNKADQGLGTAIRDWLASGAKAPDLLPQGPRNTSLSETVKLVLEAKARTKELVTSGKAFKYRRAPVDENIARHPDSERRFIVETAQADYGLILSGDFYYTHTPVTEWANAQVLNDKGA